VVRRLGWVVLPIAVIGTTRVLFLTMPQRPGRLALLALGGEVVGAGLVIATVWTLAANGPRGLVSVFRRRRPIL